MPSAGRRLLRMKEDRKGQTAVSNHHEVGRSVTLAGLWEKWKEPATGEWIRTFTIVTTDANELVSRLHDRMPVIIGPSDRQRWMDPDEAPDVLLRPYPAEEMMMWPVSTAVNSPKNDTRELIEPIRLDVEVPAGGKSGVLGANEAGRMPSDSE
jgi:putative SOS response-associated peptidase YedK